MNPLLVFDLDGTLIDSAPDIVVAMNRTLQMHGKVTLSDEVIISHIGEGLKKLVADLFSKDDLSPEKSLIIEQHFHQIYEEEMLKRTTIFPGVEDFLSSYQGPIGIITNKNFEPAKKIIKHLGLDRFPWVEIYGADSLPERKPSPLPLHTIMNQAKYKPEHTLMIGDGLPDVVSAARANVRSIAIEFGYTAVEQLQEHKPIACLKHYNDLKNIIHNLVHNISSTKS